MIRGMSKNCDALDGRLSLEAELSVVIHDLKDLMVIIDRFSGPFNYVLEMSWFGILF